MFDKVNTEHTAEVDRCVKEAKALTPPVTKAARLLDYVLRNSTIKFRTDGKYKTRVAAYIRKNCCTAADIVPPHSLSWHKNKTPASPLDELIVPVLLVGTLIVIAYYSCMRQSTYFLGGE